MNSPDTVSSAAATAAARRKGHLRGWIILAGVAWLATVVLAWWMASRHAAPTLRTVSSELHDRSAELDKQQADFKDLRQQIATLKRSDQISRNANLELQSTLADREEEISGLRADVDFYERLVGSTGQRQGLRVHEANFEPEAGGTWHYMVTLTQNLNRGAISKGQMRFVVDGVRAGKLVSVKWDELLQKPGSPGKPFSFRYFQQLEDSVMLPPGFTPQRVRVSLSGAGSPVDQSFPWNAPRATP
jgi:cell division protein FtsL